MKLLDAKAVGELLGVDRKAIPQFVRSGQLEVVYLPGRRRKLFTLEGVERFIKNCTVGGPDPGHSSATFNAENQQILAFPATSKKGRSELKATPHLWRRRFAKH